jgi:carbamoyl-phosphate synthase large subunit
LVVKPRWGTGSIGVEIVRSDEELQWAYGLLSSKLGNTILADISRMDADRAVVVQEFVAGSEYGLDIINDLTGHYVATLIKRKLSMRAGETDKAITVNIPELERLGQTLARLAKHVAIMDCDVLVTQEGRVSVLELNPRFGGGYPFSHVAGANIPAAVVAWAEGREPDPAWLKVRSGVVGAKYDTLAVVEHLNP